MKEEVLSVDNIQIQERSCDWKSAIETAVKPLIQNGFVERSIQPPYFAILRHGDLTSWPDPTSYFHTQDLRRACGKIRFPFCH